MGKSNKVILALYGVGIIMAVVLIAWIFSSVKTSSVEISADQKIDITPEQIKSIKDIGEWEFLAISDEEMVDTVRKDSSATTIWRESTMEQCAWA